MAENILLKPKKAIKCQSSEIQNQPNQQQICFKDFLSTVASGLFRIDYKPTMNDFERKNDILE